MSEPEFTTIAEVAARFRVSKRTVERLIASGKLPAMQFGERLIRIRKEDADRLAQTVPSNSPNAAARA